MAAPLDQLRTAGGAAAEYVEALAGRFVDYGKAAAASLHLPDLRGATGAGLLVDLGAHGGIAARHGESQAQVSDLDRPLSGLAAHKNTGFALHIAALIRVQ